MNISTLIVLIKVILVLMLLLIIAIYAFLGIKKKQHFQLAAIQKNLDPLITHIIIDEASATEEELSALKKLLHTNLARKYLIDELIKSKQNHSGIVAEKIVGIYLGLDLRKYSLEKIGPKKAWHVKARGIQELYMMEQKKYYPEIYDYTDASNEYVRNEAQIGMIHLTGFKGLSFLENVSHPITDWQQIKLLEQLKLFPEKSDISKDLPNWLQSKNDTVVVFALRLCNEYQYYQLSNEIENCLYHNSPMVKTKAIEVFIQLENKDTANKLLQYLPGATKQDRYIILNAMPAMASEREAAQLIKLLDDPDPMIQLKAALALHKCTNYGMQVIEEKASNTPEPYQRILQHILSAS